MNHLQHETSPYLLQHQHNPVNWYAWKPEALAKAKAEDKPILVSIGYSTCHWCHVMERESFENEEVAALMNEHFICIKVDREERPDVDQIYMEACQVITGAGGWPLNCFLLPDGKPFYAGTYFPPQPMNSRPSWPQVIVQLSQAFNTRREEVEKQAKRLVEIIAGSGDNFVNTATEDLEQENIFTPILAQKIFTNLEEQFDTQEGGFGAAPKFPGTMNLHYLLNYHHFENNENAKAHALYSINRMIQGGIYDQLGGGFSRYTVDKAWLVPHFEKMLYDNALIISLLSDAYKVTKDPLYQETIEETLTFIEREMTSPEGGFYAAQDADSEGVEGKYYVWDQQEIEAILGDEAKIFNHFYGVSNLGNWEGHTILWRERSFEEFAEAKKLEVHTLKAQLKANREKLFAVRDQRIHPGLDDKILLDWNALMCSAYANAYTALGKEEYKQAAVRNLNFLLEKFVQADGTKLFHTYKDGQAQYDAFLNDYAYLIEAIIDVYQITFDLNLLAKAKKYTDFVIKHFLDKEQSLFYFTSAQQTDLVVRKKELYDSAVPSGNSTMVRNLQRLGIFYDHADYKSLAQQMLRAIHKTVTRYPASFGRWALGLLNEIYPMKEIAVVGQEAEQKALVLQEQFIPNKVVMAALDANPDFPLVADKVATDRTLIFVCENYACQLPVESM